jgi:hypothetical protein
VDLQILIDTPSLLVLITSALVKEISRGDAKPQSDVIRTDLLFEI